MESTTNSGNFSNSNQSNESNPFELPLTEYVLFDSLFVTGSVGFALNVLLLILLSKKLNSKRKEYMIILFHKTLSDAIFCMHLLLLQTSGVLLYPTHPAICMTASVFAASLSLIFLMLEGSLALNRYVAICRRELYTKIYGKRSVHVSCVCIWIVGLLLILIPQWSTKTFLGKIDGLYCNIRFEKANMIWLCFFVYPIPTLTNTVVCFCYYKLFVYIRKHQNGFYFKQKTKLQEDRSVMHYIGASTALPMMVELPCVLASVLIMFDSSILSDKDLTVFEIIYCSCPTANAILTLTLVKPIKREVKRLVKRMSGVETTTPVVAIGSKHAAAGSSSRDERQVSDSKVVAVGSL